MSSKRPNPAVRICALFGGQNALGRILGLKQSTIYGWVVTGNIPYYRVQAIVDAAYWHLDPPRVLTAEDFVDVPQPRRRPASVRPLMLANEP
jgi:hypothetical protein